MGKKRILNRLFEYDVLLPALLFIFVAILFVNAFSYDWRTAELPLIIGGITLLLLSVELSFRLFRTAKKETKSKSEVDVKIEVLKAGLVSTGEEDPRLTKKRLIYALAAILFFLVSLNLLGYVLTTFILCAGLTRLLGFRRHWVNVIYSAILVVASYLIFGRFLGISLPMGMIIDKLLG